MFRRSKRNKLRNVLHESGTGFLEKELLFSPIVWFVLARYGMRPTTFTVLTVLQLYFKGTFFTTSTGMLKTWENMGKHEYAGDALRKNSETIQNW